MAANSSHGYSDRLQLCNKRVVPGFYRLRRLLPYWSQLISVNYGKRTVYRALG